jgi:MFS family permease
MARLIKISDETRLLRDIFLPFYAIHCMEQIYVLYGAVLRGYGLPSESMGWILGVFFVVMMPARLIGGWVLENFGIRRTLVWSSMMGLAGGVILFFSEDSCFLIAGRALLGTAFGINSMGLYSYQAVKVPEGVRGVTMSLVISGGMLPMATVVPLGEWLLLGSHTKLYLAVGPILSVVCLYFGSKVGHSEKTEKKREKNWGAYGELLSSRTFVILALSGMMISLGDALLVDLSLLAGEYGVVSSYFFSISAVTAIIIRVPGARILNALPRLLLLVPFGMLMSCSMLLVSMLPMNSSFLAGGLIYGIGVGFSWPMLHALISDTLPVALRPKGMAVVLLLYDAGWFLIPLLVGYISPLLGIALTFGIISLSMLLPLALLQLFYWTPLYKSKKSAEKTAASI